MKNSFTDQRTTTALRNECPIEALLVGSHRGNVKLEELSGKAALYY
jgi:hypothetical protein